MAQKYLVVSAKTLTFSKNPVFQKTRFLTAQKYLVVSAKTLTFSKTRFFNGSEVLSGQRKNPDFFKNPVF